MKVKRARSQGYWDALDKFLEAYEAYYFAESQTLAQHLKVELDQAYQKLMEWMRLED